MTVDEWVVEVDSMTMVKNWETRSIYKLSTRVTDLNKKAYQPQVVSFGPYHYEEKHLMSMEEHKNRALYHFLKRTKKPLSLYMKYMTEVVQELKDSYDLLDPYWQENTSKFLKLMILDGCFMLEVLRYVVDPTVLNYHPISDPIFSTHGMIHVIPYIRHDMLLLENQLPMLVLNKLVAVEQENVEKDHEELVSKLILKFWQVPHSTSMGKCLHVLHVFRKSLFQIEYDHIMWRLFLRHPKMERSRNMIDLYGGSQIIGSAMELKEAGIRFEINTTRSLQKEISYIGGVLSFPVLVVDDTTESMLLNLIAFERLYVGAGDKVTSYVYFMNVIINSVEDVILLQSHGIIHNSLESNKAVVQLFNLLAKDITFNPHSSMGLVLYDVNAYRMQRWVKIRANFFHAYHLSTRWSPWASWSIIFGIVLSIVQTAYTIYPYHHPNK